MEKDNNITSVHREVPNNIMAEQAVIGAIIVNNDNLEKIADFLYPHHFYMKLHGKIFETIVKLNDKGIVANEITLKGYFESNTDGKNEQENPFQYLVKLVSLSAPINNLHSLAKNIHENYIKRRLISIGENIVNEAYNTDVDHTANLQLENAEVKLFELASEGTSKENIIHVKKSLIEVVKKIEISIKSDKIICGVDTGFYMLNDILGGGFQNSDLIILAARPSMGKTALALNIAINASESVNASGKKRNILFFSLEMSSEQLVSRVLSVKSKVDSAKIRRANLSIDEFMCISNIVYDIGEMNVYVDDTPALSISEIRTKSRRLKRQDGIDMIIIDYLQLIRGTNKYDAVSRVLEIAEITNGLKALAKELNIPVVALSQLSRAVESREDKRPHLSDLRESGNIEQDADVVMFIYRPEYYLFRKMPLTDDAEKFAQWQRELNSIKNLAEIIIAKHRNGPIGSVSLFYDANTTSFYNVAENNKNKLFIKDSNSNEGSAYV